MNAWPDFIFPGQKGFRGTVLDDYLSFGYYRMQHLLFTTHHTQLGLQQKAQTFFWLRIPVKNILENTTAKTIRKKCAAFTVVFNKARINNGINDLYNSYIKNIDFEAAESCRTYLHDPNIENPFHAKMLQIKDGNTLIAAGYFDVGKTSLAGILNFYNPAYKKYSLGKYLMLKKLDYARNNKMEFYYTGYISTATNNFDYKLFPDKKAIEVFLPLEKIWVPFHQMGKQKLAEYFDKNIKSTSTIK